MSTRESGNISKALMHIPAVFSIAMTCVMIYQGGPVRGAGFPESMPAEETYTVFYNLNYLFVLGILIYVLLEYCFLDVKKYRFRRLSLWIAAFTSLGVISSPALGLFIVFLLLSPLLAIVLIVFSFTGNQPKISEGRFYPAIFGLLSFFWFLAFVGKVT